jgi:tetratricopeptide (TPR) repeat protein
VTHPGADPLVGRTIAHYDIVARLGGGGMGVVYKAIDRKLGRVVALKFLPPQWSHDDTAKQRFVREAQAASATQHPNICTVHDIATADDGQLFIVMGYYEGRTLKQRLESGALPIDEALDIATQIADGLARAHAQGVIHRDIKPGNLILTEDGVRIVDFGLATFADALQLTVQGSTLGTAAYMSPEQVRGEAIDARSDVWSAGVVLYQMLTGHPPFRGAYAEAVGYAIRNEPPPPIRAERPEVPEDVEQVVFRALHKDPAIRYQSGRELARALRQVRGYSVPMDLRTEPVSAPAAVVAPPPARRRGWIVAVLLLLALVAGTAAWLFSPTERSTIAVAPVVNQTGDEELNRFRLALTRELIARLTDSRVVRVVPYDRLLQIIRRYRAAGGEISSREALRAITTETGAPIVVVPTLLWDAGKWKMRVDYQDARSTTSLATEETAPQASSLAKEAVYELTVAMSQQIRAHVATTAPWRASLSERLRDRFGSSDRSHATRFRTLDAAAVYEQGLDAYERQEYAAALQFFSAASEHDPRHPLPFAWRSRVATIMRHDDEAASAASQAMQLVTDTTPPVERMFADVVSAEARRDYGSAESSHRQLIARYPDEPLWRMELGAFFDRRLRAQDAIVTYLDAAARDSRLPRPQLELCRQYNRLNESPKAIEHGSAALERYRALGHGNGEAVALFCLADALRLGTDEQRAQARSYVEMAAQRLQMLDAPYNFARAQYYIAMIAGLQGNLPEAVAVGEKALGAARGTGNSVLEALVLMNLGVAHARMRHRGPAVDYYRQSSRLFEALGDDLRAAQTSLNAGVHGIEYGGNLEDGLRDVQNALAVVTKLGDKTFEISCRHAMASYYAYRGRPDEAARELNKAIALARERDVQEILPSLVIDLAMSHAERGDYNAALERLDEAIADGNGPDTARARIRRAEVLLRQRDITRAAADLDAAEKEMTARANTALRPLLYLRRGELNFESGRMDEARRAFHASSELWTDDLPDAASVEARAWEGLLAVRSGNARAGRKALDESLRHAESMGRLPLQMRIRALAAQAEAVSGRSADDVTTRNAILARDVPAARTRR